PPAARAGRQPGRLRRTAPCSLPGGTAAELSRLRPLTVTIVGGAAAVCDTVAGQVGQITGATVQQLAGADRYATSVALSRAGWVTADTVYLAGGTAFPDGLAGGALASHGAGPLLLTAPCAPPGAPLLLVPTCSLPATVAAALQQLHPLHVEVVGGTAAVCDAVLSRLAAASAATA